MAELSQNMLERLWSIEVVGPIMEGWVERGDFFNEVLFVTKGS